MKENLRKDDFKKQITVQGIEEKNKEVYKNRNEEQAINEIIDMVDKKPEFLDNLSTSELKKINRIYDKKIEELKIKIDKLKKNN